MRLRHPFADTGHLLIGVMQTKGSIGSAVLLELEINMEAAIDYLQTLAPTLEGPPTEIRNADEFNAALTFAADESAWLGHHYIGTEHLLLGITRANVGNARTLLRYLNISPEQIRRHVRRIVSDGARELDLQAAKRSARLTELSRRTISAAEQMAVTLDHPTIGLGHLLLVMLLEERSPISKLLYQSGLEENALRQRLEESDAGLLMSIEAVLNRALDQAESLGSHYTGTDHLLLTLAADENGSAVLEGMGVNAHDLAEQVRAQLLDDMFPHGNHSE